MSEYASAAGFIQFDPKSRDVNGKAIRDVTIRALGSNKIVRVTVWPDHAATPLAKGDFIAVDGKFSTNKGQNAAGEEITYYNLSASTLLRFESAGKAARETTNTTSAPAAEDKAPF